MKTLVYTFRTCKQVINTLPNTFIFSKLHEDLKQFHKLIISHQPEHIVGIGNGPKLQYESSAINQFGKYRRINKEGPDNYQLFIPPTVLQVSNLPTISFCNWTAYSILQYTSNLKMKTKVSFIHTTRKDVYAVVCEVKEKF